MSKTCELCKRSYSDQLDACPHCAEVVELSGDDIVEVVEDASDSAVDLGLPAVTSAPHAGDPSGEGSAISFVEWASLVEEKSAPPVPAAPADEARSAPPVAPAIRGDFPAGSERLDIPPEEDALAGDLAAVRSIFAGDASSSFSRQPVTPVPPAPLHEASDSALDLLTPNREEQAPRVEATESGIDLVDAELEQEIVADSIEAPPLAEAADSGIDLAEVHSLDSGIDWGKAQVVDTAASEEQSGTVVVNSVETGHPESHSSVESAAKESSSRPASDAGLDLSGDDIVAAEVEPGQLASIEMNGPNASESGRDLIAEEVESSLDLPLHQFDVVSEEEGADAVAGQLASEEEEVDLTEMSPAEVIDSSAVDLGGSSTFPAIAAEPSSAPKEVDPEELHGGRSKNIHGAEELSPSEVNLGGRHDEPAHGGDFFDEGSGLGIASESLEPVETEPSGLHMDEEPAAGMDDEQPALDDEALAEEELEKPAKTKREKSPSMVGVGAGGVVLGAVLATLACCALWFFNIEPPQGWRGKTTTGPTAQTGAPAVPTPAPIPFSDRAAAVRSGDLDRAQKDNIEAADETKADEVAARGEYRVRNYLAQQSVNKKPIEPNDPTFQAGVKDLEAAAKTGDSAAAADALFYLGVSREAAKDFDGALKIYKEGAEKYKTDAAQEERFDAGINRVAGKSAGATGRVDPADDGAMLALLLTTLQQTEPAKPAAPMEPAKPVEPAPASASEPAHTEAGAAFWLAVKKAQEGKYDQALAAIKEASELHTKRRFTRLGKAQNPNTDPTEEIFLRSCEELKNYWELQKKLAASGSPLVKGKDPAAAVDAVLAENKDLSEKLTKATTDAATQQKAVETAEKNALEAKTETEKAKQDSESTKKELTTAKEDLEAKKKDLDAAGKSAAELMQKLKTAEGAVMKESDELKNVAAALTPKFLKPESDDAALLSAVKDAARLAAITDPQGMIHSLQGEVAGLNDVLKQRWKPDQMLTFWMPLLRDRGPSRLSDKAILDANRVLNDPKASAEDKARAHAVKGTALRNEEKYAEAKVELEQAKANLPKADGVWLLETEAALKEASDPSAYYAARAETYHEEKQIPQALAMLNRALETAAPEAKGRLIAERGALHLEQALAHGNGAAAPKDADLLAAEKDADEAKKTGSAAAFYLSGRIEELLGHTDEALQDYQQALKAHGALDADGARYRAAVARMLILPRTTTPVKVGKNGGAPGLDVLAALMVIGLQPGELPGQIDPATQEALKLADEILSANPKDVPFEARAQALAIKGLWTAALRTYVEGLRPYLSPEHAAGLLAIINGHPNLRRPTVMTAADPMEAEKHYAAGLNWYNDRQYAKAEKEFFTAVEEDGQDARYYYYLGLSHLMLGDRDAYEDFAQGARLESQNRPPRAAVSAALERVQGPARLQLNDVRDRPR